MGLFEDVSHQAPVSGRILASLHPSMRKDGPDAGDVHVNSATWKPVPHSKKRKRGTRSAGGFVFTIPVKMQKALQPLDNAQTAAFAKVLHASYRVLGAPSEASLVRAVTSGDGQPVIDSLNWSGWEAHLRAGLGPVYRAEAIRWGEASANQLRANLPMAKAAPLASVSLQFAAKDPAVVAWIAKQVGALITHIAEEVRLAIRDVIHTAYTSGVSPMNAVPMVRAALGEPALFPTWQKAVFNYAASLAQAETPGALELAAAYRDRLVEARSTMIARTEILAAQNAGRLASFQQAVDAGFVDAKTARKEWLSAPEGACPICDKLNGTQVGLNEKFSTGDPGPPAHPSCRCTTMLRLGHAGELVGAGALAAGDFKKYNRFHDPHSGEFTSSGGALDVATSLDELSEGAQAKIDAALGKFGTSVEAVKSEIAARIGGPDSPAMVEGAKWYPQAHELMDQVASSTGLPTDRVTAAFAVISPRVDWDANARIGQQMCAFQASGAADGLSPQEATDAFIAKTPSVTALPVNIMKGFAVLGGANLDETLGGLKVRSFYNNITGPGETGEVTIDGHMAKAFGAASGLTMKDAQKLMGMKSVAPATAFPSAGYIALAEATRQVADAFGTTPDAVQAAYWNEIRSAYTLRWPEKTT